jgi:hypothetical protein
LLNAKLIALGVMEAPQPVTPAAPVTPDPVEPAWVAPKPNGSKYQLNTAGPRGTR